MGHAVAEPVGNVSIGRPRIAVSPWFVLIVLLVGEFVILLDTTILEVAIPNLLSDLNTSLDAVLWVLNAYLLVYAVLLIPAGRLGDIVGPRKLFIIGMAIFTASSAACMIAPNAGTLIGFRVIQGVGAAILTPQPGTIITFVFPPEKRATAFGLMGAIIGLAAVTGPTLGGILTTAFSWRAIFFPNIPVGILAIIGAFLFVPELSNEEKPGLDVVGVVLASAAIGLGLFGIMEGERYKWGPIWNVGSFSIGPIHASLLSVPTLLLFSVVALVVFFIWESRQDEPLLPLSLFSDRNFSISNLAVAMVTFGLVGQMVVVLLFLQSVRNFTPLEAGIAVVPNALLVMIGAPLGSKLSQLINAKYLVFFGLLLYAAGVFTITRVVSLTATGLTFTVPLMMTGFGMGITIAPIATLAIQNVAPSAVGAGSGFMNAVRQVGAALGAGVIGAVLPAQIAPRLKTEAIHFAPQLFVQYNDEYRRLLINGFSAAAKTGLTVGPGQLGGLPIPAAVIPAIAQPLRAVGTVVFNHAFLGAIQPTLLVPSASALVVAAVVLFMRPAQPVTAAAVQPEQPAEGFIPSEAVVAMATPLQLSDTVVLAVPRRTEGLRTGAARQMRVPFLEMAGTGTGKRYPLDGMVRIGRLADNDIVVDDPKVSRQHAQFSLDNGTAVVRDLSSGNGTFVNGQRISGNRTLHDGDEIGIGDSTLVYHNDLEAARPRLVPIQGNRGDERAITRPLVLGRSADSDIVVDNPKVSRKHAMVSVQNGQVVVRDLASLNGTTVNGELVYGESSLRDGDVLTVGDASFVFKTAPQPAAV